MERRSLIILVIIAVAALGAAAFLATTRDETPGEADATTSPAGEDSTTQPPDQSTVPQSTVPPSTLPSSTSLDSTSTTLPSTTETLGENACAPYASITTAGTVGSSDLVETSGIAASRTSPGILWGHNDSRDGARVYAIGPDGSDLGGFDITGAFAFDWEDMAAGPGPDPSSSHLYFGDIGDNFSIRGGRITVYRVAEPDPTTLEGPITGAVALEFEYPDGTYNAEALFVADDSIYIVTKDRDEARVYRGTSTGDGSGVETLQFVMALPLGAEVSGADISWDGRTIALRGYNSVWLWRKASGQTVAEALAGEPCESPSPDEVQGEAIAFLTDGAYATISEGAFPDLFVVPFDA
jgi:hypothetical protein